MPYPTHPLSNLLKQAAGSAQATELMLVNGQTLVGKVTRWSWEEGTVHFNERPTPQRRPYPGHPASDNHWCLSADAVIGIRWHDES